LIRAARGGLLVATAMDQTAAINQIQEAAKQIALQFMKIHPALRKLENGEIRDECLKSMHEMTVQLESIKKRLIRLQKTDDSSLL
jgi:thymidylate synthase ThyX